LVVSNDDGKDFNDDFLGNTEVNDDDNEVAVEYNDEDDAADNDLLQDETIHMYQASDTYENENEDEDENDDENEDEDDHNNNEDDDDDDDGDGDKDEEDHSVQDDDDFVVSNATNRNFTAQKHDDDDEYDDDAVENDGETEMEEYEEDDEGNVNANDKELDDFYFEHQNTKQNNINFNHQSKHQSIDKASNLNAPSLAGKNANVYTANVASSTLMEWDQEEDFEILDDD
jgi:hypothetical protein